MKNDLMSGCDNIISIRTCDPLCIWMPARQDHLAILFVITCSNALWQNPNQTKATYDGISSMMAQIVYMESWENVNLFIHDIKTQVSSSYHEVSFISIMVIFTNALNNESPLQLITKYVWYQSILIMEIHHKHITARNGVSETTYKRG